MSGFCARTDVVVFAEMGETQSYPGAPNPPEPCVLMANGDKDNVGAAVLIRVEDNKIKNITICTVAPHSSTCKRLGQYPK